MQYSGHSGYLAFSKDSIYTCCKRNQYNDGSELILMSQGRQFKDDIDTKDVEAEGK
jgi:hypothetical protein